MINKTETLVAIMKEKSKKKQSIVKCDGYEAFEDKMDYYPHGISLKGTRIG